MKPEIARFIHEYGTSDENLTYEEWGKRYNVAKNTIWHWVSDNRSDIDRLTLDKIAQYRQMMINKLESADSVLLDSLASEDERMRLKAAEMIYDRTIPKKAQHEVNATINIPQIVIDDETEDDDAEPKEEDSGGDK